MLPLLRATENLVVVFILAMNKFLHQILREEKPSVLMDIMWLIVIRIWHFFNIGQIKNLMIIIADVSGGTERENINMWRLEIHYPNGDKVVSSSDFRQSLLAKWHQVNRFYREPLSEGERNSLLMDAFNGMTLFDYHPGLTQR